MRTGAPRITAGHAATWTLTLDKPVNYFAYAVARPVKAVGGPQLRVGDLTKRFRERYFGKGVALATPLYRTRTLFFVEIPQHQTTGIMRFPPGVNTGSPGRSRCGSGRPTSWSPIRSAP